MSQILSFIRIKTQKFTQVSSMLHVVCVLYVCMCVPLYVCCCVCMYVCVCVCVCCVKHFITHYRIILIFMFPQTEKIYKHQPGKICGPKYFKHNKAIISWLYKVLHSFAGKSNPSIQLSSFGTCRKKDKACLL